MNAKPHSMLAAAMIAVAVAFASGCASVHCSSPGAIDGINRHEVRTQCLIIPE